MPVVAGLVAAKFALWCGVFYLLGLILQMGVPFDALKAGFQRTWLGAAATVGGLVVYMIARMLGASTETTTLLGALLLWAFRLAIWAWVVTSVYRVTRWRKGKLAITMGTMLALDVAADLGLEQLHREHPFLPALGTWTLHFC
ncbi:MAG TPA: hypothetical protein VKW04_16425 [Planctomycetota bacterium]|nr:hypothetical protein [Planctomycetota bacterium]